MERFQEAQGVAEEVAGRCSGAVIQTGSSLREEDFTEWSDVDLLEVTAEEPNERWEHERVDGISVSILRETRERFQNRLEEGNPFELVAVKHGEILKGDSLRSIDPEEYGPTERTSEVWLQGAFNNYSQMLRDAGMPVEFYSSAYHSVREFGRVRVVKEEGEIVEGDNAVREALEEMDGHTAELFWDLREKRQDPPETTGFLRFQDLLEDERYRTVEAVEAEGEKALEERSAVFPSIERLREELEDRGFQIATAPTVDYMECSAMLSGEAGEERKLFRFDMETGRIEEIGS